MYKRALCTIDPPEKDPLGVYSNALRLSVDGSEILLDFCLYSETEDRAKVVSRIRVPPDFLAVISKKIEDSLTPTSTSPMIFVPRKSNEPSN